MKKAAKSIIGLFLCLCIAAGLVLPSFANKKKTAFIVVSGMNTFPLCEDDKTVFPPQSDMLVPMIAKLITPVTKFLADKNYDEMGDRVLPVLESSFSNLACDADGNSVHNIDTFTLSESTEGYEDLFESAQNNELTLVRAGIHAYGAENTYFFNYDWRDDPLCHADKLNELIKSIKAENKYDRIALSAFSMGGTVTCSYLYKYGSADLDSVSLCATAFQGTSCVGSLFTGDMDIGMDGLIRRIAQLTRDNTYENIINYLNGILSMSGVNAQLEDFVNSITDNLKDRIYDEFLIPVFGYMPGIWALVDDANYESAKEYMLRSNDSDVLLSRIDEYHYNVQQKANEILEKAKADTDIYLVAQYNMQGLPISVTSDESNNDYLIDAVYASGGAVCSKRGETLGADYTQAVADSHNHLSADGQIDASTCMFPEQTWFIRDMGHVDFPFGESSDFIIWLSSGENLSVSDSEKYTQFMTYNYADGSLTPVTQDNPSKTAADIFFGILTKITQLVFKLFSLIF